MGGSMQRAAMGSRVDREAVGAGHVLRRVSAAVQVVVEPVQGAVVLVVAQAGPVQVLAGTADADLAQRADAGRVARAAGGLPGLALTLLADLAGRALVELAARPQARRAHPSLAEGPERAVGVGAAKIQRVGRGVGVAASHPQQGRRGQED